MKIKSYSELRIGETFRFKEGNQIYFMKISMEKDHSYFYVCMFGELMGKIYPALEDDFKIFADELI